MKDYPTFSEIYDAITELIWGVGLLVVALIAPFIGLSLLPFIWINHWIKKLK